MAEGGAVIMSTATVASPTSTATDLATNLATTLKDDPANDVPVISNGTTVTSTTMTSSSNKSIHSRSSFNSNMSPSLLTSDSVHTNLSTSASTVQRNNTHNNNNNSTAAAGSYNNRASPLPENVLTSHRKSFTKAASTSRIGTPTIGTIGSSNSNSNSTRPLVDEHRQEDEKIIRRRLHKRLESNRSLRSVDGSSTGVGVGVGIGVIPTGSSGYMNTTTTATQFQSAGESSSDASSSSSGNNTHVTTQTTTSTYSVEPSSLRTARYLATQWRSRATQWSTTSAKRLRPSTAPASSIVEGLGLGDTTAPAAPSPSSNPTNGIHTSNNNVNVTNNMTTSTTTNNKNGMNNPPGVPPTPTPVPSNKNDPTCDMSEHSRTSSLDEATVEKLDYTQKKSKRWEKRYISGSDSDSDSDNSSHDGNDSESEGGEDSDSNATPAPSSPSLMMTKNNHHGNKHGIVSPENDNDNQSTSSGGTHSFKDHQDMDEFADMFQFAFKPKTTDEIPTTTTAMTASSQLPRRPHTAHADTIHTMKIVPLNGGTGTGTSTSASTGVANNVEPLSLTKSRSDPIPPSSSRHSSAYATASAITAKYLPETPRNDKAMMTATTSTTTTAATTAATGSTAAPVVSPDDKMKESPNSIVPASSPPSQPADAPPQPPLTPLTPSTPPPSSKEESKPKSPTSISTMHSMQSQLSSMMLDPVPEERSAADEEEDDHDHDSDHYDDDDDVESEGHDLSLASQSHYSSTPTSIATSIGGSTFTETKSLGIPHLHDSLEDSTAPIPIVEEQPPNKKSVVAAVAATAAAAPHQPSNLKAADTRIAANRLSTPTPTPTQSKVSKMVVPPAKMMQQRQPSYPIKKQTNKPTMMKTSPTTQTKQKVAPPTSTAAATASTSTSKKSPSSLKWVPKDVIFTFTLLTSAREAPPTGIYPSTNTTSSSSDLNTNKARTTLFRKSKLLAGIMSCFSTVIKRDCTGRTDLVRIPNGSGFNNGGGSNAGDDKPFPLQVQRDASYVAPSNRKGIVRTQIKASVKIFCQNNTLAVNSATAHIREALTKAVAQQELDRYCKSLRNIQKR